MNTLGVVLLVATTATAGIGKPHAGGMRIHRAHAVRHGPIPPGGPLNFGGPGAGACAFGHPGCMGGESCPGAAAAGMSGMPGAGGPGGAASNRRFPNVRSQIFFVDPPGMRIGWQTGGGGGERVYLPAQLTVPARYNFRQGYIYRLKLTEIPGRPGISLYPTLEIAPSTPATDAFLTHNPIPVQFTEEDFDQCLAGNFVTKVIYLPDPKFQELAIAGVGGLPGGPETLVSTRLEPGIDPILEADRRGTILMIVRLGSIDLEMPAAGATTTVVGAPTTTLPPGTTIVPGSAPGTVLPPEALPPGASPFNPQAAPPGTPSIPETVPLDEAPVTPVPSAAPATPPAPGIPATPAPPAETAPAPPAFGDEEAPIDEAPPAEEVPLDEEMPLDDQAPPADEQPGFDVPPAEPSGAAPPEFHLNP